MVKLTQSLGQYLWDNHKDKVGLIMMGKVELLTPEIYENYLKWLETDEGKQYLKGGSKYIEEE